MVKHQPVPYKNLINHLLIHTVLPSLVHRRHLTQPSTINRIEPNRHERTRMERKQQVPAFGTPPRQRDAGPRVRRVQSPDGLGGDRRLLRG